MPSTHVDPFKRVGFAIRGVTRTNRRASTLVRAVTAVSARDLGSVQRSGGEEIELEEKPCCKNGGAMCCGFKGPPAWSVAVVWYKVGE